MPTVKAKNRGKKAYETGAKLEKRVARWLSSQFGYTCKTRELMRGKISKRPYEVDIHAHHKGWFSQHDLWVECKAYRVKRTHVTKLVESARDVRDACENKIEEWYPDMLMLVSNKGFDVDAIGMADKYDIYCVKAGKTFEFAGGLDREDFENKEKSDF
ncbi:MAG TPA: hypothetical protein ENN36_06445 [Candidatus Bathyarchaeota archaeon]|nr:hypothetical protein [Candidatus Bathyarchaeota archaeon]